MFFNIIIFIIILMILALILNYSKSYKEGFLNFPDAAHNAFVMESQQKYNQLTNTINLTNPALPITPEQQKNINLALSGLSAQPSSSGHNLISQSDFTIPQNAPGTFQQAQSCESASNTCAAFDDPTFAANCGMSFDIKGVGMSGKPHVGGLYVSPEDRQKQTERATNVLNTGSAPYDPFKVYQPTLGKARPGTFALTKDQCLIVKEKVDCAAKQTFNSPNCTQCYTSQRFARVGPETGRIPSTLNLFGNGLMYVWTSDTPEKNLVTIGQTPLDPNTPVQVNVPGNAEGTVFIINVVPNGSTPPYIAGFIQGQTPRGVFKLDLMNLIQADTVTGTKPRINGSITVNGFKCLTIIPGNGQTQMSLSCLMPFSFLNMYDGDALTCDNGPIITQSASATFLESDPCFGQANKPGNYKLECLQSRWIELGGTAQGSGYPSNQSAADALQKDGNGNPLDIDTIVNNLAPKMLSAQTGTDANGQPLSLADWNTVSMWATGTPINTPCDGPNSSTGPLSQACLSYLYLNQGVTSHIGPTYTLPPSQVASMKGQTTPNTYCQPGAPLDPATANGLKYGQSLGGVNTVKQTYDQINRLANDNTQKNDARSNAIQQCYGVTLDAMGQPGTGVPEVFAVGTSYNYTKDQAASVCNQYGAQVATTAQLQDAQNNGADWCFTGWVSDSSNAMYPITTSIQSGCATNIGLQTYTPSNNQAGVNCYGQKPPMDGSLRPFNQTSYNQPTDGQTTYSVIQGGYMETSGPQPSCFSNLSPEQAQQNCNSMGNQCAGFSYATDGSGGCYKGDVKGGKVVNSGYVGYIKLPLQQ